MLWLCGLKLFLFFMKKLVIPTVHLKKFNLLEMSTFVNFDCSEA